MPSVKRSFRKSKGKLKAIISGQKESLLVQDAKNCTTRSRPDTEHIKHKSYRTITKDQNGNIIPDRYKSGIGWCKSCNANYDYECNNMAIEIFKTLNIKIKESDKRKVQFNIKDLKLVEEFCKENNDNTIKQNIVKYLMNCYNARQYYQEHCIYDLNPDNANLIDSHQYYIQQLLNVVNECNK